MLVRWFNGYLSFSGWSHTSVRYPSRFRYICTMKVYETLYGIWTNMVKAVQVVISQRYVSGRICACLSFYPIPHIWGYVFWPFCTLTINRENNKSFSFFFFLFFVHHSRWVRENKKYYDVNNNWSVIYTSIKKIGIEKNDNL